MIAGFNRWLALRASAALSSMGAVYVFTAIGVTGIVAAVTGNVVLTLVVGAVSGYFLQLVALPLLAVAARLAGEKVDDLAAQHEERHRHLLGRLEHLHWRLDGKDDVRADPAAPRPPGAA